MHYRVIAAIVVCLVGVAAFPQPCEACSCRALTTEESYAWADHIFRGRVGEVEQLPHNPDVPVRARLEIDTVWKGEPVSEAFVEGGTGADCRVPWQAGKTYIVVAQASDSGALRTYSCQGTGAGLVSHRPDPFVAYGAGTPVPDGAPVHDNVDNRTSYPSGPDDSVTSWVTIIVAAGVAASVVAFISRRRLRESRYRKFA